MKRLPGPFRKLRPDMPSNQVLGPPAEQVGGLLVDIGIVPVPVESHKSIADTFKNVPKLLPGCVSLRTSCLFPDEQPGVFFLRAFALCNVQMTSGNSVGLAVRAGLKQTASEHPAVGAIFVAQPKLDLVAASPAFEIGFQSGESRVPILGVKTLLPFLKSTLQFMILITELAFPFRRKI